MKVLVAGSVRNIEVKGENDEKKRASLREAAKALGRELAKNGHVLLVGSEDPDDIDPHVVEGFLESDQGSRVEVHLVKGAEDCYVTKPSVENIRHRYFDWDVTVLDTVREDTDGVIVIGGKVGVVTTGIGAWMLGRPTIPFGGFGGGAEKVWDYGSSDRRRFYFNALTDAEIDHLNSPWGKDTAPLLVELLGRCADAARRAAISPWLRMSVALGILATLIAWVWLLALPLLWWPDDVPAAAVVQPPFKESTGARFLLLLGAVCSAGAFGAFVQSMRGIRDGKLVTATKVTIDAVLGVAAGFLTAALYLLAQIAINGELGLPHENGDYSRVALVTSMAAVFASLYLDAAFSRFDTFKESVISGTYGSNPDGKS